MSSCVRALVLLIFSGFTDSVSDRPDLTAGFSAAVEFGLRWWLRSEIRFKVSEKLLL
jgi:hypothetical protein